MLSSLASPARVTAENYSSLNSKSICQARLSQRWSVPVKVEVTLSHSLQLFPELPIRFKISRWRRHCWSALTWHVWVKAVSFLSPLIIHFRWSYVFSDYKHIVIFILPILFPTAGFAHHRKHYHRLIITFPVTFIAGSFVPFLASRTEHRRLCWFLYTILSLFLHLPPLFQLRLLHLNVPAVWKWISLTFGASSRLFAFPAIVLISQNFMGQGLGISSGRQKSSQSSFLSGFSKWGVSRGASELFASWFYYACSQQVIAWKVEAPQLHVCMLIHQMSSFIHIKENTKPVREKNFL